MTNPLVSVIIPTYNRFKYLLNAIESVQNQTYKNVEIIVINDCSDEEEYYSTKFPLNVKKIDLEINQKHKLGYISVGHIRNFGLEVAKGKYIATLDDDDVWLPRKLEIQISKLTSSNNKFSCTEGYVGYGEYDKTLKYKLYNRERFYKKIAKKHKKNIFSNYKKFNFPNEFDFNFLKIHNSIITSSVVVERDLINFIGGFRPFATKDDYAPDYDCWLGLLRITNCDYIDTPLFYYDESHGSGRIWK